MKFFTICLTLLILTFLFSCSKEDDPGDTQISLSESDLELDYGSNYQVLATFNRDGYTPESLSWSSSDTEVATVDNSGKITSNLIGQAEITVKTSDGLFKAVCKLEVMPTTFLFKDPVVNFGESKAFVKANETRTLENETATSLIFKGENLNVRNLIYTFESSALEGCGVLLKNDEATAMKLVPFLEQRFNFKGKSEDVFMFMRGKISLGLTVHESLGLVVIYFENESIPGGRIISFHNRLEVLSKSQN